MEKRDEVIYIRVTKSEKKRIFAKMQEMGITSVAAYGRKMILDGYCVNLDMEDVKEMVSLLRRCSNNLNQYAKQANITGCIYKADIEDLKIRLDEIWEQSREIIRHLSTVS